MHASSIGRFPRVNGNNVRKDDSRLVLDVFTPETASGRRTVELTQRRKPGGKERVHGYSMKFISLAYFVSISSSVRRYTRGCSPGAERGGRRLETGHAEIPRRGARLTGPRASPSTSEFASFSYSRDSKPARSPSARTVKDCCHAGETYLPDALDFVCGISVAIVRKEKRGRGPRSL